MLAVVDTSTWISCARAGLLPLLDGCGLTLVTLDVVHQEAVRSGKARGHVDATLIESAMAGRRQTVAEPAVTADAAVLQAAARAGLLVTNDLALGRRARNQGIRWLRTADLVVLAVHREVMSRGEGRAAISALRDAQRLTTDLADSYLEELR